MAYNPYFPQNYQQGFQQPYPQQLFPQYQTRMVEVVPVDTVEDAAKIQVQIGGTILAIAKDDSFIAVKSVGMNGANDFNVFDKRPPAPPAPTFDPAAYVTHDELEKALASIKGVTE